MRKTDAQFSAVWKRLCDLELNKLYEPTARTLERAVVGVVDNQNLLIAALVEAGILVEKKEDAKQYLQFGDKKYTIRKVK